MYLFNDFNQQKNDNNNNNNNSNFTRVWIKNINHKNLISICSEKYHRYGEVLR